MDERDCFETLLARIEELAKENARISDMHTNEQSGRRVAEREVVRQQGEVERLKKLLAEERRDYGALERFVESDEAIQTKWRYFVVAATNPAPDPAEDLPF